MRINLLPPEEKQQITFEKIRILIMRYSFVLALSIIFVTGALFLMRLYTSALLSLGAHRVAIQQVDPELSFFFQLRNKIERANEETTEILRQEKQSIDVAASLKALEPLIPKDVVFAHLTFETATKAIFLSGHAPTREGFLGFLSNLKSSDFIERVDSPLSNVLVPKDVSFSLTIFLK